MSENASTEKWVLIDESTKRRVGGPFPSQQEAEDVKSQKLTESKSSGGPSQVLKVQQILVEG